MLEMPVFTVGFLIGLISLVVALAAVMAFCTHSSPREEVKKPVARYPVGPTRCDLRPQRAADGGSSGGHGSEAPRTPRSAPAGRHLLPATRPTLSRAPSGLSVPAASACSLPSPRQPPHVGGEKGGLFSWSPRSQDGEALCPCLLVPEHMEFVFAVREVLTVLRQEPLGPI